jgi:hypothetical protein
VAADINAGRAPVENGYWHIKNTTEPPKYQQGPAGDLEAQQMGPVPKPLEQQITPPPTCSSYLSAS